jgi:hypothetical protein
VFDRRVSIDKVDVLKGAISTRPAAPSLLNVYIDEIVYFFEQTQYNVVIFEILTVIMMGPSSSNSVKLISLSITLFPQTNRSDLSTL